MKINLPVSLTVDQFQQISRLEHLTDLEKTVKVIDILSDKTEDEIRNMNPSALPPIMEIVAGLLTQQEQYYPIMKHEDKLYGFQNIDKMSLGEYTDLEKVEHLSRY